MTSWKAIELYWTRKNLQWAVDRGGAGGYFTKTQLQDLAFPACGGQGAGWIGRVQRGYRSLPGFSSVDRLTLVPPVKMENDQKRGRFHMKKSGS